MEPQKQAEDRKVRDIDAVLLDEVFALRKELAEERTSNATGILRLAAGVKRFKVMMVCGFIILGIACSLGLYFNTQQAKDGNQARKVLCAQEDNARDQLRSSQQYLDDVRSGKRKRIPGITDTDIQQTIDRQRAFLTTFETSGLVCPVVK